jgi:hypothetical protein
MSGDDALLLGYGLASCSVVRNQQRKLRGSSLRIDSRYGVGSAAIGATAAIISVIAVLARFDPSASEYFMHADNLRTTLRVADDRLAQWSTRNTNYTDAEALGAERRALRRAHNSISAAMSRAESDVGSAIDQLNVQLASASIAAFPPLRVARDNQEEMEILAAGGAFLPQRVHRTHNNATVACPPSQFVVPLSGLPGVPTRTPTGCASETESTSWLTSISSTQSDTSSEFEIVEPTVEMV